MRNRASKRRKGASRRKSTRTNERSGAERVVANRQKGRVEGRKASALLRLEKIGKAGGERGKKGRSNRAVETSGRNGRSNRAVETSGRNERSNRAVETSGVRGDVGGGVALGGSENATRSAVVAQKNGTDVSTETLVKTALPCYFTRFF